MTRLVMFADFADSLFDSLLEVMATVKVILMWKCYIYLFVLILDNKMHSQVQQS